MLILPNHDHAQHQSIPREKHLEDKSTFKSKIFCMDGFFGEDTNYRNFQKTLNYSDGLVLHMQEEQRVH